MLKYVPDPNAIGLLFCTIDCRDNGISISKLADFAQFVNAETGCQVDDDVSMMYDSDMSDCGTDFSWAEVGDEGNFHGIVTVHAADMAARQRIVDYANGLPAFFQAVTNLYE